MHYYSQLLTCAFKTLSSQTSLGILGLVSGTDTLDASRSTTSGEFEFASEFLPEGTEMASVGGIDQFVDDARKLILESRPQCVFALPPLLGTSRYSAEWKERHGNLGVAETLAEAAFEQGSPVECLALLVPFHFTSSLQCSEWRRDFFPAHSALIVEHCHSNFSHNLGMETLAPLQFTTVILRRDPGPIRFLKITTVSLSEGPERIAADLERILKQPAGKTKFGYIYQGPLDLGYPCSYDYYSEETEKLRAEIGTLGSRVTLSSVADILVGFRPCRPSLGLEARAQSGFPYITATAIAPSGLVNLSETQIESGLSLNVNYLKDGDFCIPKICRPNGSLPVGVFEGDGRAIAFGPQIVVIRPHPVVSPAQRQVLLSYLRSPLGYRLTRAKQTLPTLASNVQLSPHLLAEFPVPLADEELVISIQRLNEAKSAFNAWITEIDKESNAIIEEATASGSRRRLLQAGQLARQRHRAGEQVEELDHRIRTQFPHCLAYIWRQLQVTGPDRYHRLKAVLKAAEGHTCFLAMVAVIMSRSLGQPISYVNELSKRLSQSKHGTNFGDWYAIIKEVNERKEFRNRKGELPFCEVTQLLASEQWEPNIRELMKLRNDDSHGRIAATSVSPAQLEIAEQALKSVFRATEFLTDYRLIFLTQTKFDSIRKITKFNYRELTGDNPLAPLKQDQSTRSDLESESLYLCDRQGQLHLFRPLLNYLECPECHQMVTYFMDTFDGSAAGDLVGLKSFETNSVRHEALANEFRHVGLLSRIS